MKANELMIGDWVMIDEPDRYAGAIGQIQSLMHHNENESAFFHVFVQGSHGYVLREVCNEDIRPIELKKVHLAKNGFKAFCENDSVFIYEDGFEVRVDFDDGIKDLELEPMIFMNINFAEKCCGKEISYVHELQQGMRYFGIEKEIKL